MTALHKHKQKRQAVTMSGILFFMKMRSRAKVEHTKKTFLSYLTFSPFNCSIKRRPA